MLKWVVGTAFAHSLSGPPWLRPMVVQNVRVGDGGAKVDVTVVEVTSRTEKCVVSSDFGICLGTPNEWSGEMPVPLPDGGSLTVQYQWLPYPESKEKENLAAAKVQAAWKGKQTREELAAASRKPREVVARKGVKTETGEYYLISVVKEEGGRVVGELHSIGDPAVPVYTVLDSLPIPAGREDDITVTSTGKLTLSGSPSPSTSPSAPPPSSTLISKGDLALKVTSANGLSNVMLKMSVAPAFGYSLGGPPWVRPVVIQNVGVQGNRGYVSVTVVDVATRADLISKTVEFTVSENTDWSKPVSVSFSQSQSVTIQYQWLGYPPAKQQEEAAAVKLQSAWRGKEARNEVKKQMSKPKELLGRSGVKGKDGRLYLISFYKDEDGVIVSLNPTGDPQRPIYEELGSVRVPGDRPVEDLRERVVVNEEGRLQIT